jgi:hypothetical protein
MTKKILIYFILGCFTAFSKSPTNPYSFAVPDFNNLLPFSTKELELFKKEGIKRIETNEGSLTYFFDDFGKLIRHEISNEEKKKRVVYEICKYKYNNEGMVTLIHAINKDEIRYDSLSYDNKGRVSNYFSYINYLTGKKEGRGVSVQNNYKLVLSTNEEVILADTNASEILTLNNQNEVLKRKGKYWTDSITVELIDNNVKIKKYWVKTGNHLYYIIGQEMKYESNLLQHTKIFEVYQNCLAYTTFYYYDKNQQLILSETKGRGLDLNIISYSANGLKEYDIFINRQETRQTQFKYHYQ